jgi:hypothetical protein
MSDTSGGVKPGWRGVNAFREADPSARHPQRYLGDAEAADA